MTALFWWNGNSNAGERGNVIGIVSAKLDAGAALAVSGALTENVNYAVKSSMLLSFMESVRAVSAKLKAPSTADRKFENLVKSAKDAAVMVLVPPDAICRRSRRSDAPVECRPDVFQPGTTKVFPSNAD
jgi:hypothetical protein